MSDTNLNADLTKFTYTVKEDSDVVEKKVIEKRGEYAVQFSLEDITKQQQELSKMKKEAEGTLALHGQLISNYVENHPALKEFSDEVLHRVYLYYRSILQQKKAEATIKACAEELDNIQKEKEHIISLLGLVPSTVEAGAAQH